jgi:primosomal protein DnaI
VLHIKDVLPRGMTERVKEYDAAYFKARIPELSEWDVSDEVIERHRALLLEYLRQQKICARCQGFESCGKEGDMQGFVQTLEQYGRQITTGVARCRPFLENQMKRRIERWTQMSGGIVQDQSYTFANFPREQRLKYPRLMKFAEDFAETYEVGKPSQGIYLFGPPGVGKTHLMLAVFNRLQERGVPCLFVRSDSIFDRMRHIIADNGDLEPFLEACANAPVLGIDEFAQERANEFTLEKLFRIINHRFHAQLPTWFTSNFAPPDIYRKNGTDILESVGPLRSRILQMAKLARMDGEDARQRNLQSLT